MYNVVKDIKRKCVYLSKKKRHRNDVSSSKKTNEQAVTSMNDSLTTNVFYILKWIACITMVIDHVAMFFQHQCKIPPETYMTMKYIGRTAYPLFAYLLVESFHHTKSKGKHLFRIGILALVSEIPYDFINISRMPVEGEILNLNYQNVCLSLFISFLLLMITDTEYNGVKAIYNNSKFGRLTEINLKIIFVGLAMGAAYLFHAEYSFDGVLFVFLLNFARDKKHKRIFQALAFLMFGIMRANIGYLMLVVPFTLIVLAEHSAKSGRERDSAALRLIRSKFSRRLAGIFYPLHMIVLIAIRMAMVW